VVGRDETYSSMKASKHFPPHLMPSHRSVIIP